MTTEQSWPFLLNEQLSKKQPANKIINASISGDTSGNGLARLPELLKQHKPNVLLIELGANDGLRGFMPAKISSNIENIIKLAQAQGAQTLLMQINVPPNYGKRYSQLFSGIYPKLNKQYNIPLIPFFLKEIILNKPKWIMKDGMHPTVQAQPWIAEYMEKQVAPYLH